MTNPHALPAPADNIVNDFVEKISSIQPSFIDGIYLTGSIPMKDFYSNKSDIDFLVLCKIFPDHKIVGQLKQIHKTISKGYPKPDLSGTYLTSGSLQSDKPEEIKTLIYHEGSIRYGILEMAPVVLSELKTNAITIYGESAESLPIEVKPTDLNNFLYKNINSYWTNWINKHTSYFQRRGLLFLFPRFTEWSVLGVARQLCTLQTGKIVSKTEAGNYCLDVLPEKFHPILKEAIEIRKDNRTYPLVRSYSIRPSFKRCKETIECVNYIIAEFNKTYADKQNH